MRERHRQSFFRFLLGLCCLFSALLSFHIGPVRADPLTFCVVGDWQIPDDNLTRLAERLVQERPDLVLIPGDLVMAKGGDPAPWDAFFDRIRPLLAAGILLAPVPGNHDFDGGLAAAQQQWTARWNLPGTEFFYSFDAGPAHFIALCSTWGMLLEEFDLPGGRTKQIEWLAADLARSRQARWRFLFHHEPGTAFCRLSAPIDGPGSREVSDLVEPLAWRQGVDLIFRGHQHLYERTYPVNPISKERDDSHGIGLITVGGGCIAYRPQDPADAVPLRFDAVIGIHQMHYLQARIDGDMLTAEAKNLAGEVFDRFAIRKLPDGTRQWEGLPAAPIFLVENQPRAY